MNVTKRLPAPQEVPSASGLQGQIGDFSGLNVVTGGKPDPSGQQEFFHTPNQLLEILRENTKGDNHKASGHGSRRLIPSG